MYAPINVFPTTPTLKHNWSYSEGFDSRTFLTSILEHKQMSIEGLYTTFEASMNVSYNTNVLTISDMHVLVSYKYFLIIVKL